VFKASDRNRDGVASGSNEMNGDFDDSSSTASGATQAGKTKGTAKPKECGRSEIDVKTPLVPNI